MLSFFDRMSGQKSRPHILLSSSTCTELRARFSKDGTEDSMRCDAVVIGLSRPTRLHANRHGDELRGNGTGVALSPGTFVAALEHASRIRTRVVGKRRWSSSKGLLLTLVRFGGRVSGEDHHHLDDVEADHSNGALWLGLQRVVGMFVLLL
jgi:hypothetical protein